MKRKFSKILGMGLTLALLASLLLTAAPVAAAEETNYGDYTLTSSAPGTAVWSTEEANSGKSSVKLFAPADGSGYGNVAMTLDMAFADLDDFSAWVEGGEVLQALPLLKIEFLESTLPTAVDLSGGNNHPGGEAVDLSSYDRVNITFQPGQSEDLSDTLVTDALAGWQKYGTHSGADIDVGTGVYWTICDYNLDDGTYFYDYFTWDEIQAIFAGATVTEVKVELIWPQLDGGEAAIPGEEPFDYTPVDSTVYVDDILINDTTYVMEPEPIFMDALFYQTGDTVTVTVIDPVANDNPAVQESVVVNAASTITGHGILLGLLETGVDTGVFTETFTLVGTTPGTGQLLVTQGSEVTVTYDSDTDTAEVDSVAPVVEIDEPEDADYVAGSVSIEGTYLEDNLDTVVLTIGDTEVEATYGGGSVTYTWDTAELDIEEEAVWPDGAYTIEVVATDLGGLVGSDSIDVTVDNTEPSIEDAAASPPTVFPATETEVTFSASIIDAGSGIALVEISGIPGIGTLEMLDDGLLSDVEADDGIYTAAADITASEANYTLTITATDSVDVGDANVNTDTIILVVATDIIPPVITDPAITYEYGISAQPGDPVTIFATVTDDVLMGTVTAECDVVTDEAEEPTLTTIILLDDGETPDVEADDGIYTGTATVDSDAGWGDYPVTITATDAKGNEAIDETLILAVRSGATGIPLELEVGWNLISLPLIPVDADITVVISATTLDSGDVSSVGTVVGYDPATGDFPRYIPGTGGALTEMEDGVGYWVFMEEADTLTITGREWPVPPEVPPVYSVVEGWNLIGVKSIHPIPYELYLGNLYEYDLPEFSVIWGYSAVAGRYFSVYPMLVVEDLFQGHGYWLWMKVDGTIVPPQ